MLDYKQDRCANFGCYLSRRLCIKTSLKAKSERQKLYYPLMKGLENEGFKEML
jgi:hypothetical protein